MKKIIMLLVLMIGASTALISCKKDEEVSEKEKTRELLISGKWYYQSYKNSGSSTATTCFDVSNFWEFKSDGTFTDTWDFGDGTYLISEDGKTITATVGQTVYTISISAISSGSFSFTLANNNNTQELVLSKTAGNCRRKY